MSGVKARGRCCGAIRGGEGGADRAKCNFAGECVPKCNLGTRGETRAPPDAAPAPRRAASNRCAASRSRRQSADTRASLPLIPKLHLGTHSLAKFHFRTHLPPASDSAVKSSSLRRMVRRCGHSVICAFHAARTAAKSAALRTPRRRRKTVFSAVTSRSRRATEGLSSPAACQSLSVTSSVRCGSLRSRDR